MRKPKLACVVMSLAAEPGLPSAVASLARQEEDLELLVVNSGGGDPVSALRVRGVETRVIDVPERLTAGAVRNLGIDATEAPVVAFLAADCIAEPGWVSGRLHHHRDRRAVASAMTNAYAGRAVADASYFLLFFTRMPSARIGRRQMFGLSYDRTLFDEVGRFREDLPSGEDFELNQRLIAAGVEMAWAPEVRTAHRHGRTLGKALTEHYRRGGRIADQYKLTSGKVEGWIIARRSLLNVGRAAEAVWRQGDRDTRRRLLKALPAMIPTAAAYATGALVGTSRELR